MYDSENYVTASDDGTLRLWAIDKKEQIELASLDFDDKLKPRKKKNKEKFLPDNCKGRCLAVSPQKDIVVGCKDGTLRILDKQLKPKFCKQYCKK